MIQYHVLQDQWLIISFLGGLAVLGGALLAYMGYFHPRLPEKKPAGAWSAVPWFLILTYAGMAIWAVIYTVAASLYGPY